MGLIIPFLRDDIGESFATFTCCCCCLKESSTSRFVDPDEDGLASERVFDKFDAQNLKNTNRYNCFITVTCEFTKFDDPLRETAGEYVYWNPKGGAVGLITTTRQIYVNVGVTLNEKLTENLFDDEFFFNSTYIEVKIPLNVGSIWGLKVNLIFG